MSAATVELSLNSKIFKMEGTESRVRRRMCFGAEFDAGSDAPSGRGFESSLEDEFDVEESFEDGADI